MMLALLLSLMLFWHFFADDGVIDLDVDIVAVFSIVVADGVVLIDVDGVVVVDVEVVVGIEGDTCFMFSVSSVF